MTSADNQSVMSKLHIGGNYTQFLELQGDFESRLNKYTTPSKSSEISYTKTLGVGEGERVQSHTRGFRVKNFQNSTWSLTNAVLGSHLQDCVHGYYTKLKRHENQPPYAGGSDGSDGSDGGCKHSGLVRL